MLYQASYGLQNMFPVSTLVQKQVKLLNPSCMSHLLQIPVYFCNIYLRSSPLTCSCSLIDTSLFVLSSRLLSYIYTSTLHSCIVPTHRLDHCPPTYLVYRVDRFPPTNPVSVVYLYTFWFQPCFIYIQHTLVLFLYFQSTIDPLFLIYV